MYYIYRFLDENNKTVYVGRTNNFSNRMRQHFNENSAHLSQEQINRVAKIKYHEFQSQADMILYEIYFILKYKPEFNTVDTSKDKLSVRINDINWKEVDIVKVKERHIEKDDESKTIRIYDGKTLLYDIPKVREKYNIIRQTLRLNTKFDDIRFCYPVNDEPIYRITCVSKPTGVKENYSITKPLFTL